MCAVSNARPVLLPLVKPLLRAYLFGHVSTTAPRILGLLFALRSPDTGVKQSIEKLRVILASSLASDRFPSFCAILVGSYTLLQVLLLALIRRIAQYASLRVFKLSPCSYSRLSRCIAAFVAGWFSLQLLNKTRNDVGPTTALSNASSRLDVPRSDTDLLARKVAPPGRRDMVGKTMGLTLLASVRAIETLVNHAWRRHRSHRTSSNGLRDSVERLVGRLADAGIFSVSAGVVMWAWIYLPERLPRAYRKWIAEAAQVDCRLVEVLRKARWGQFVYGIDTGQAHILQSMCKEFGWPMVWGDPAKTIPVPCEIVHMGTGPCCHWHALARLVRAFRFSLAMYLPLQLLVKVRQPSLRALQRACIEAIRSSAFLGAFVSLFYYGVCLSRTRLGPKLFSPKTISPMMWDSGLCVGVGCIACGWSILIEAEKRRQELAFFVAPRAAAILFPRRYERKDFWRERLAFSLSTAVLLTLAHESPRNIRGVLGILLNRVIN